MDMVHPQSANYSGRRTSDRRITRLLLFFEAVEELLQFARLGAREVADAVVDLAQARARR
jgi:hypothetical protein